MSILDDPTSQPDAFHDNVIKHYSRDNLEKLILSALQKAGKDIDNLTPEDLAPIDEFHVRGRKATIELAHEIGLEPDMHVLDVGSGIGGPSRYIAGEFGCRVTGIGVVAPDPVVGVLQGIGPITGNKALVEAVVAQ